MFPLVSSTTICPARRLPLFSASSSMFRAALSLTLPPGLKNSSFARMRGPSPFPPLNRSRATRGVLPIAPRTLSKMGAMRPSNGGAQVG